MRYFNFCCNSVISFVVSFHDAATTDVAVVLLKGAKRTFDESESSTGPYALPSTSAEAENVPPPVVPV